MLRAPVVGHTESANLAIGPGLPDDPSRCVKTVVAIVDQRSPVSLGAITTAYILNDNYVTIRYEVADGTVGPETRPSDGICRGYIGIGILEFLVIGRPLHQHRELPTHRRSIPRWPVEIRSQPYPIAHGNHHMLCCCHFIWHVLPGLNRIDSCVFRSIGSLL